MPFLVEVDEQRKKSNDQQNLDQIRLTLEYFISVVCRFRCMLRISANRYVIPIQVHLAQIQRALGLSVVNPRYALKYASYKNFPYASHQISKSQRPKTVIGVAKENKFLYVIPFHISVSWHRQPLDLAVHIPASY